MPAIVQDHKSREVLMLAFVNKASLEKMLEGGKTCFYSRSRKALWIKGESSGHFQNIKNIYTDCDSDTLLIEVEQIVGACHLGYRSCFMNLLDEKGNLKNITQEKVFDPKKAYGK